LHETNLNDDVTIKPSGPVPGPTETAHHPNSEFGDYVLLNEIARGGMGVVYKARQKSLDRVVAIKMILEGQFASQLDIDRFKIEAQSAANLDHPGIVPIYEIGEQAGKHFFSMALVEGRSLDDLIKESPLNDIKAAKLLRAIAAAMNYAHQRGIIHRDLKPGNVLLDSNGNPRVTDFGLAKRTSKKSELTVSGQTLGTPSYMSPEQASGRGHVTEATDVYALGAILYAMLTGKPPFEGTSLVETLTQVIEKEPTPIGQKIPAVNADLEIICLKCLEKDAVDRYATARELIDELDRFLNDEPIEAKPLTMLGKFKRWRRIIARNNDVRLRSSTSVLGYPLVDIAFGRDLDAEETYGHAKGVIAFGDVATGLFAFGKYSRGLIFAFGQYAFGLFSFGLFSCGVVTTGFASLGIFSGGGISIGVFAMGFVAIGVFAYGVIGVGVDPGGLYRWQWAFKSTSLFLGSVAGGLAICFQRIFPLLGQKTASSSAANQEAV
jgi:serine/threonine protein kinase